MTCCRGCRLESRKPRVRRRMVRRSSWPAGRIRRPPPRRRSWLICAPGLSPTSRRSDCALPSGARIRLPSGATSTSQRAPGLNRSTAPCASSPGESRRSRCTCMSRCPAPRRRCERCVACASTCRCCWRCRPTRRSGRGATRGWPILDAQTRAEDNAALAALVQCVVRLEATEGDVAAAFAAHPEVLDENRFLASRDGMRADFIDPERDGRRPARELLDDLLTACAPHAAELGCEAELAAAAVLADDPGYQRQRTLAGVHQSDPAGPALAMLVRALAADFTGSPRRHVAVV